MEIALLRTLPIGGCVEMSFNVDASVTWLRVLRKTGANQTFTSAADANSIRIIDAPIRSSTETQLMASLLDYSNLENGDTVTYAAYGYIAPTWFASLPQDITITPTADQAGADPLDFLVQRVEAGLKTEVLAQRLKPQSGSIPVYTAPPQTEHTTMPVVTVHLDSDVSSDRALGEHIAPDRYDNPGDPESLSPVDYWEEGEGWLSKWSCSVIGWSVNPDERNSLRKALKRIIQGNLPIFEAEGMIQVDFNQRDSEDFTTYNVPMYLTTGQLTCLAPALLTGRTAVIDTIETINYPNNYPE